MNKPLPLPLLTCLLLSATMATAQTPLTPAQQQVVEQQRILDALSASRNNNNIVRFDQRNREMRGTPFLYTQWLPADIQLFSSAKALSVPAKYDVYRRELRIKRPQGDSLIVEPQRVQRFTLQVTSSTGLTKRVFERFINLTDIQLAMEYFEVLGEKNGTQLLKLTRKELLKRGREQTGYGDQTPRDEYFDKYEYYIRQNGSPNLKPIKLTSKSLAQAAPEWQAALASFGKTIRNEQEAVAFLQAVPGAQP